MTTNGLTDGKLKAQSRVASILLSVLGAIAVESTLRNLVVAPAQRQGGTNIVVAALLLWCAIRSIQASFKYHRFLREGGDSTSTSGVAIQ